MAINPAMSIPGMRLVFGVAHDSVFRQRYFFKPPFKASTARDTFYEKIIDKIRPCYIVAI